MSCLPDAGLPEMSERVVVVDGIRLCLEPFGAPSDPAMLLIGGMSASMDWWDVAFCERLSAEGRYVVRYDHRDTGRSSTCPAGAPDYTGADLELDALRVLDALGIDRAHLVGMSMGGAIAQGLAARHPERVRTVTLVATTAAGARLDSTPLPRAAPRLVARFAGPGPGLAGDDRDAVVARLVEDERAFAGPLEFDEARARRVVRRAVDRAADIGSRTNHGILPDGPAAPFRLADIAVPTLVLHGTDDPLFPYPHGEALAAEIPGAVLLPLPGMGHELPPPALYDLVVGAITRHTAGPDATRA